MSDSNKWAELRKPFPKEAISTMPRGGIQLSYVGHAATTDRLNTVLGPDGWNWEPMALNEDGSPKITIRGNQATLWGWFYVGDLKRPAVGTAQTNKTELEKELIGDLIRNGAMRFGVALDLWSKDELESNIPHAQYDPTKSPEEPSRDVKDEPISEISKTKLKQAIQKSGKFKTSQEVTNFYQFHINKDAPTTERDAQELIIALAED